ncbi:MAG: MSHA biogenesis protein MshI [Candidatus Azotimanducaceae bacterium]
MVKGEIQLIKQLMRLLRREDQSGMLGIEIGPYGIAVAVVGQTSDDNLDHCMCHFIEGNDLEKNGEKLKEYLDDVGCGGKAAHIVLHPDIYDIYFVDRPEVEDSELKEAIRWKIKDLVDIPLDELVVDAFALPDDAYGGSQKKAYAVTIERAQMDSIVSMLDTSGVDIRYVSISELAIENLLKLRRENDDGSSAVLRLRTAGGTLSLSDGGYLYLTRALESGISMIELGDGEVRQEGLDSLLLEIQRSLDFYDSQLGKGRVRRFLMAPTRIDHSKVDDFLESNLGIKVVSLNINELFEVDEEIPDELQAHCFAAIGAACGEGSRK